MKEEMLEAIYGTVERLEQKVDELSASPKNAGAETVPASNDTTRLENSIIAMFGKEEEAIGKISKLRDAIGIFFETFVVLFRATLNALKVNRSLCHIYNVFWCRQRG